MLVGQANHWHGPGEPGEGDAGLAGRGQMFGHPGPSQAHGRRHTGGFPIDLGGIAGETALVRGKMVSRV